MREKVLIIGALADRTFCGPQIDISEGRSWRVDFKGDMKGKVCVVVDDHRTLLFRDPVEINGKFVRAEIIEPLEAFETITVKVRQVA